MKNKKSYLQILNPYRFMVLSLAIISPSLLIAHPVSFEGGTMTMGTYMKDWMENDVNYTFSPSSAFGISQFRIGDGQTDRDYVLSRFNKRFRSNGLDYQSNMYLSGGLGARTDQHDKNVAGYTGLTADYETRKVYTLGLAESIFDGDSQPKTHLQYRLGFAPYTTHFQGMSTWLIGQIDYRPFRSKDIVSFSPVVRFFYRNILLETGADFNGSFFTSWMYNF
jgi:hypothetical protein